MFSEIVKIHFAGFVKMGEKSAKRCGTMDRWMWTSLWKMWITICSEKLLQKLGEFYRMDIGKEERLVIHRICVKETEIVLGQQRVFL